MENGWNLIDNSSGSRGQNSNCSNLAWSIWELGTSRFDWNSPNNPINEEPPATATATATIVATSSTASTTPTPTPTPTDPEASTVHAFMFSHQGNNLYDGAGSNYHPDPHLMCLKLGKRHYFEDTTTLSDCHHVGGFSITKRGKPFDEAGGAVGGAGPSTLERVTAVPPATVPRCQVEGCHVALVDAKDYHRRHKVCEMHSKAEKVVVLGIEQRFCQQCSRFHAVSQFDDSKRSCRRRLAGHNERRRKSSHDSVAKNPPQGRALSLLSTKNNSWISSADLSSRCSAALSELIAENRAAILARQLIIDRDWHWRHQTLEDMNGAQTESSNSVLHPQHQMFLEPHGWERFNEAGSHVTLDLMQVPSSAFGFLSVRGKSKEEEEQCSEWWSSFGGAHVV